MKHMQNFHSRIFSKSESITLRERGLAGLARLNRDQINSAATFDPWYVWSAEAVVDAH